MHHKLASMSIEQHGGVFGELVDGVDPDKGGLSVNFFWLKQFVVKPASLSERNVRGALITDWSIWAWRISACELRSTMAIRKEYAVVAANTTIIAAGAVRPSCWQTHIGQSCYYPAFDNISNCETDSCRRKELDRWGVKFPIQIFERHAVNEAR